MVLVTLGFFYLSTTFLLTYYTETLVKSVLMSKDISFLFYVIGFVVFFLFTRMYSMLGNVLIGKMNDLQKQSNSNNGQKDNETDLGLSKGVVIVMFLITVFLKMICYNSIVFDFTKLINVSHIDVTNFWFIVKLIVVLI